MSDRGFEIVTPEGVEIAGSDFQENSNTSVVGADLDGDGNQDLAIPYRADLDEGIFVIS